MPRFRAFLFILAVVAFGFAPSRMALADDDISDEIHVVIVSIFSPDPVHVDDASNHITEAIVAVRCDEPELFQEAWGIPDWGDPSYPVSWSYDNNGSGVCAFSALSYDPFAALVSAHFDATGFWDITVHASVDFSTGDHGSPHYTGTASDADLQINVFGDAPARIVFVQAEIQYSSPHGAAEQDKLCIKDDSGADFSPDSIEEVFLNGWINGIGNTNDLNPGGPSKWSTTNSLLNGAIFYDTVSHIVDPGDLNPGHAFPDANTEIKRFDQGWTVKKEISTVQYSYWLEAMHDSLKNPSTPTWNDPSHVNSPFPVSNPLTRTKTNWSNQ